MRSRSLPLSLLVCALLLAGVPGCRRHQHESAESADRAVLRRQREGLTRLLAAAARGPLVPFDKVLVTVDESLVQGLLESALPLEQVVASRYRVRVSKARVEFEDGFALCRLEGRASLSDRPAEDAFADITLFGALDIVDLDPRSGTLRGRVTLIALDARKVEVMGVGAKPAEGLIEDLGRERLEAFAPLLSSIEIPVAVQGGIDLPGLTEKGVQIEGDTLPLRVAVQSVEAFQHKLWISVDASTDTSRASKRAPEPSP